MKSWLYPLWVIIDVLVLIATMALWITAPEYLTLNIGLSIFAVTLGMALAFARLETLKVFMSSAYFKKALYHSVNGILVLSIMGLLNYLGNKNYKEFDVTTEKRNSLTEQSEKVLEMVKAPLKMTVYAKREEWPGILNLLKLYEAQSNQIKLEAIDTDLRPDLVKSKGITQNGTIEISYRDEQTMFTVSDELSVTNALLKALRDEEITLYFTTGHQEAACTNQTPEGISLLCDKLKAQNYTIKELNLTRTKEVPADARAVFIAGPTSSFLNSEVAQLKKFVDAGGSLFLSLAPAFKPELYDNLIDLSAHFGLELGQDIVIDRLSTVQGAEATIPIVNDYEASHPITAGFTQRTIFPLSASVNTLEGNDSAQLLAFTSSFPGSWAETDLKGVTEGRAEYDEKTDAKGPIGLLGIGENTNTTKASRFVLLGSSSFLFNAYQAQSGNTILFLNAVSWLVNDEGIISFNRPGLEEPPVILSGQHLQMIFVISILLVPIVFFGAAIFVYRRRRIL